MQYFDEEAGADLKAAVDDLVGEWPDVTVATMFGCPSYQVQGTLFAVVVTDGVALTRLPADQREAVRDAFDAGPFDAGGRRVTSWVQVPVSDLAVLDALRPHLRASYEAARAETSE